MESIDGKQDFLERIVIVLCRPEGSLNIGSVCRSMANMGVHRLSIVPDTAGIEIDRDKVRMMALHSYPIFENAGIFSRLEYAVTNAVLTAGITRRTGRNRKSRSLTPRELTGKALETAGGDIALVFGNEQNGLNDEELKACTCACHIPSHPANPSLNLSHAVQLICYDFFLASGTAAGEREPVPLHDINALADTVESALKASGYYDKPDRFGTRLFFRDIFARANLTRKELTHLEKVFQKLKSLMPGE